MSKAFASAVVLANLGMAACTTSPPECPEQPMGWSCPGNTCAQASNQTACAEWLAAHNLFRCMADVPAVTWNAVLAQNVETQFRDQAILQHSNSFSLTPPLGPSGENEYMSQQAYTPLDVVRFWYQEIQSAPANDDYTEADRKAVGHYTTMMWQGVNQIGCFINANNVGVCEYWDGKETISCSTPNMATYYTANVYPQMRNIADCQTMLQNCGITPPAFTPSAWEQGPPATTTLAPTTSAPTTRPVSTQPCSESSVCDEAAAANLAVEKLGQVAPDQGSATNLFFIIAPAQTRPGPVVVAAMAAGLLAMVAVSFWSKRSTSTDELEPLQALEEQ